MRRAVDTSTFETFWQQGVDFHILVLSVIFAKHAIKLMTKASVPTSHARWCSTRFQRAVKNTRLPVFSYNIEFNLSAGTLIQMNADWDASRLFNNLLIAGNKSNWPIFYKKNWNLHWKSGNLNVRKEGSYCRLWTDWNLWLSSKYPGILCSVWDQNLLFFLSYF